MAGFVFFDTETTGLRKEFDQIVHFAAIRTDHELNEVDRFEIRSRLMPDVAPHPRALLTNGLPIASACDPALPSRYEMMRSIASKLTQWSPAIFVGYNSIAFDEEFLRHGFFQTLHDAYLTSRRGNGRADAFALALAAHALPPRCVRAPLRDDGRRSFKLADIAAANGLRHDAAHDAASDASATLELCRLVRLEANEVWQRFQRFSNKASVAQFVESEDGFVLSEFFGGGLAAHRPVAIIGRPPGNPNRRLCIDLSLDPEIWSAMSDDELRDAICRKGSPVRGLAINGAPCLTELWAADDDMLATVGVDVAEARARRVKEDVALCSRIVELYTSAWSERPVSALPERRLYDGGFPSDADRDLTDAFHAASPIQRGGIVSRFSDPRLAVFGRRLLHMEHPASLSDAERAEADRDLARRLLEDAGGPLTLPLALAELDLLEQEHPLDPRGVLPEFREWLLARIQRARACLTAVEAV
jgi:exodeoxyribonuclease-1